LPVAHLAKAVALRFLERPEDVLESCNTAIRLNPKYVEGWDKRGAALKDLNRLDEALQSCETAISLQADFAPAYAHAGLICLQMGQFERGWRLSEWHRGPEGYACDRHSCFWNRRVTRSSEISSREIFWIPVATRHRFN
jgi:tetratricopeptide (TPR) repeat protein